MVITVEHLSKSFDYYKKELGLKNSLKNLFYREKLTKEAVCGISFQIEEGEMVGFLGPNGAGKTTTLKMIYEIDDATYKTTLGELTELLDVRDLLNVQVRRLSLGERMKMELIAALIHKPRLIFLDEPTIGLDLLSQKKIREFFKYYNQEKKATVILTSHYMGDVENLCKRSIIINQGRIVYDGDLLGVNEVFAQSKIIRLQLSAPVEENVLTSFGKVKEHTELAATLEVARLDVKERSKAILDQLPVVDFTIEDIPVEEGIALLYQKKEAVHG
jgi:ABC-2 type transport system ATP-binding protein